MTVLWQVFDFDEEGDAMFSALVTPLASVWLIGLLILWTALLFGGFAFGRVNTERAGRMPVWTRMASSAVLVLAAWSWYLVSRGTTTSLFALLIAIGMTLGLVGDLFMARLLPVSQYILLGMGAFGLGHVAYIAAGIFYGNQHGLAEAGTRYGVWALWLVVGLIGWYFAVFQGQRHTALHWVALPYALLLASTAGVATGLAVQEAALWPMAIGAALFLVSDLILAAHLFNGLFFPLIEDAIWLTYGPGQMLIVYSVGSALNAMAAR